MKHFIIGATGYIGNVVAKRLIKEGHNVTGLARSKESADALKKDGLNTVLGSLNNPQDLIPYILQADVVIYAAYGYERLEQAEQELKTGQSHLTPLLQAMYNTNKRFILTSGSGVFPDTGNEVYTEETSFTPTNKPLNQARRALELEVQSAAAHQVHTIILRPPTAYGHGGSFMVPRFLLDYALQSKMSVYCQGTKQNKWSAVHIDDLVDLFLLAIYKAKPGTLYNTASESGITTENIAKSISHAAGLKGKIKAISLDKARTIFNHWADWWALNNQCSGEKAKMEVGWSPTRASLLNDIQYGSYAREHSLIKLF